ncbi:MAG: EamA family transporter, partial [Planctomycetota bacterium]
GLSWAFTVAGLRWLARGETGGPSAAAAATAAGNLLAVALCAPWAFPLPAAAASDWALVAFLGVIQIALAYALLASGMRLVPAFEGSLLLLVEPVLNPIWAWLVHGERPGLWAISGAALILGATAFRSIAAAARPGTSAGAAPAP